MERRTDRGDRARGPSILVIEDDFALRQLIKEVLQDEGLMVETAANGRQAIEHVMQCRPALVVLDSVLPDASGEGVATELRATLGARLPILLVTSNHHHAEAEAKQLGAFACLYKPFELDDLVAAIRRGLGAA